MPTDTIKCDWIIPPQDLSLSAAWMWSAPVIVHNTIKPPNTGRWVPRPNPSAGLRESAWLEKNRDRIADASAPWTAILGERIVARAATLDEVVRQLKASNWRDALVACVRPQGKPRPRRIA